VSGVQSGSHAEERARLERRPEAIRAMFAGVARRYDRLNRILSLRRDVVWRKRLAAAVDTAPPGPVLDLATGTGDVALAVATRRVWGIDFCFDMLALARRKARRAGRGVRWVAADALALPFPPSTFAAVTVAFGVRNFVDLERGLAQIHEVLVPAGLLAVLEFHRPDNRAVAALSAAWNRLVVTPVGRALSDEGEAYAYLPASVSTFADGRELVARLSAAGFGDVEARRLTGGIAALTVGRKELA
jgi:demethylmenaquinone methyltransferase / 2-methoxy-6-polyprenyl-1,4-benzoquinol methylase